MLPWAAVEARPAGVDLLHRSHIGTVVMCFASLGMLTLSRVNFPGVSIPLSVPAFSLGLLSPATPTFPPTPRSTPTFQKASEIYPNY